MGSIWSFLLSHLPYVLEVEKRRCESGFSAVGFVYKNSAPATKAAAGMDCNMSLPEHPSTINVDCGEGDTFVPPPGLIIPEGIQVVSIYQPRMSSCGAMQCIVLSRPFWCTVKGHLQTLFS